MSSMLGKVLGFIPNFPVSDPVVRSSKRFGLSNKLVSEWGDILFIFSYLTGVVLLMIVSVPYTSGGISALMLIAP